MPIYKISNAFISRTMEVNDCGVRTISLRNEISGREYIKSPVHEFMFNLNGVMYSSYGSSAVREQDGNADSFGGGFLFKNATQNDHSLDLTFTLGAMEITICYRLYPEVAGMSKKLIFRNTSSKTARLDTLFFDDTCMAPGDFSDCEFYRGQADVNTQICFTLEACEDIIRCHNPKMNEGWLMGSTAPGVLRYFMVYPHWMNILNGYNCSSAPFAKYLEPGETFDTDYSLLSVYCGNCHESTSFRDLIRNVLPPPVAPEGIMYCSWLPFLKNINEELIDSLLDKAAEMGFKYFVLDDGWFKEKGDREVDTDKFPHGLEPIAEKAAKLGMVFGLWFNIGTDYGVDNINQNWIALQNDGRNKHLGFNYDKSHNVMCFASEYRTYVLNRLDELCNKYHLGYFKLDFSSVQSPYGLLPWGCHSKNHEHHHDWNDSFIEMYRGMAWMRTELKKRHPDLIVDFSFEAFGTETPNIAALQYSELHHVSNNSANNTDFQDISRVRRHFYDWLQKLPPERILNGLLSIQGERGPEYFLTSLAGAPLVAGDLRALDSKMRARIRIFADAFAKVTAKGPLTEFTVLENSENFDGFMRYSKDGRGIICLFNRDAAPHSIRLNILFKNLESSSADLTVPPHDCAMFIREI